MPKWIVVRGKEVVSRKGDRRHMRGDRDADPPRTIRNIVPSGWQRLVPRSEEARADPCVHEHGPHVLNHISGVAIRLAGEPAQERVERVGRLERRVREPIRQRGQTEELQGSKDQIIRERGDRLREERGHRKSCGVEARQQSEQVRGIQRPSPDIPIEELDQGPARRWQIFGDMWGRMGRVNRARRVAIVRAEQPNLLHEECRVHSKLDVVSGEDVTRRGSRPHRRGDAVEDPELDQGGENRFDGTSDARGIPFARTRGLLQFPLHQRGGDRNERTKRPQFHQSQGVHRKGIVHHATDCHVRDSVDRAQRISRGRVRGLQRHTVDHLRARRIRGLDVQHASLGQAKGGLVGGDANRHRLDDPWKMRRHVGRKAGTECSRDLALVQGTVRARGDRGERDELRLREDLAVDFFRDPRQDGKTSLAGARRGLIASELRGIQRCKARRQEQQDRYQRERNTARTIPTNHASTRPRSGLKPRAYM